MFQEGSTHPIQGNQYQGGTQNSTESVINSGVPSTYHLKTMCLAKKTVQMPTKEEHGFLLFCGLGARKWQVAMDCNSLTFKQAILNIYPRLKSAIGYTLWTLTKDKEFERIPERVNTPVRICTFLGSHFASCLIIVPVSDIVLMEEKREHLRQQDIEDDESPENSQEAQPSNYVRQELHQDSAKYIQERQDQQNQQEHQSNRYFCLICCKKEKGSGTGAFHWIHDDKVQIGHDKQSIAKRLTTILGFNFEHGKQKSVESSKICKKCLKTVTDVGRMEEQLKMTKENLVSNFFNTTSKFNKNQSGIHNWRVSSSISHPTPHQEEEPNSSSHASLVHNHPYIQHPLPLQMTLFSQQTSQHDQMLAATPCVPGLIQFYPRPSLNPGNYNSDSREQESDRRNGLTKDSDYGGSEVGSSSLFSTSPIPRTEYACGESESVSGNVSPQPFDTRSYASTFSFGSTNSSIKSKGQIKAYEEIPTGYMRYRDYEEQREPEDCTLPKGDGRDQQSSPGSQGNTSPRQMESSSSSESTTPPCRSSLTHSEQTVESIEADEDRMKPWKKRKRMQIESDQENITECKRSKEDYCQSPQSSEQQQPVNCDDD